MANWYYVRGSERVGPVSIDVLRDLFNKEEINAESYIWRKGFTNWERLKDVNELDLSIHPAPVVASKKEEPSSPEVNFQFNWNKIKNNEEVFFVKIGSDRKNLIDAEYFGPYSLNELRDAKDEKRISEKTLIYAVGLPGWIEAGNTPLNPLMLDVNLELVKDEVPLLMVMENNPLPLVVLVNKVGTKECTVLGAGNIKPGSVKLCSLYAGKNLKAKNLKINIEEYEPKNQKAICKIIELNEEARRVIQNYV